MFGTLRSTITGIRDRLCGDLPPREAPGRTVEGPPEVAAVPSSPSFPVRGWTPARAAALTGVLSFSLLAGSPGETPAQPSAALTAIGTAPQVLASRVPGAPAPGEPRQALWVVRDGLLSPEGIDRMIGDASRAGITDLLVQVRGRGDAWYASTLEPVAAPLRDAWKETGRFDPLDRVLRGAHVRGMRVHVWMNVYLVAPPGTPPAGHVVREHPEWVARDARGGSMLHMSASRFQRELTEGIYLDPASRGASEHFLAVVDEIVRSYPIDGVHLDYVRYPHLDTYPPSLREVFRTERGVDPVEFEANRAGLVREFGEEGTANLQRAWSALKAEAVTGLVRSLRQQLRMTRPGVVLSAAVKPDPEGALRRYGQDWTRWLDEDLVDVVAPMMYSTSMTVVEEQARAMVARVPRDRVWAGIAVYNQSLTDARAKLEVVRGLGMGGVSIFSYNSLPGGGGGLSRLAAR